MIAIADFEQCIEGLTDRVEALSVEIHHLDRVEHRLQHTVRLDGLTAEHHRLCIEQRAWLDDRVHLTEIVDLDERGPHALGEIATRGWNRTVSAFDRFAAGLADVAESLQALQDATATDSPTRLSASARFDLTAAFEQSAHSGVTSICESGGRLWVCAGAPQVLSWDPVSNRTQALPFTEERGVVVWSAVHSDDDERIYVHLGCSGDGDETLSVFGGRPASQRLRDALNDVSTPRGLRVRQGCIAFADEARSRVRVLDADGAVVCEAGPGLALDLTLRKPVDVAFDPAGHLYISDLDTDLVYAIDVERSELLWVSDALPANSLPKTGTWFDDHYYTPTAGSNSLFRFDSAGRCERVGSLPAHRANGLCASNGSLFLFDDATFRVARLDTLDLIRRADGASMETAT